MGVKVREVLVFIFLVYIVFRWLVNVFLDVVFFLDGEFFLIMFELSLGFLELNIMRK